MPIRMVARVMNHRCNWRWMLALLLTSSSLATGETATPAHPQAYLYQQLQNPTIVKVAHVENVVLQRDRVTVTFTEGMIYFPAPVDGFLRSAVFIGSGRVSASPPPIRFEQDNLRRLLKADDVSSNFKNAVMRFTDDTGAELLKEASVQEVASTEQPVRLAADLTARLLKEAGINIVARQLESILNHESKGIFLIQCEGGSRGRFTYILDPQSRMPVSGFGINAGEKGVIFAYDGNTFSNDVWMAFHTQAEYADGKSQYADAHNLIETKKCTLTLNLLEPKKVLGLSATLELVARVDGVTAIDFAVGEGLATYDDERRKKQLQLSSARLADQTPLSFFQEPWEKGFTVLLPKPLHAGESLSLILELQGDFMMESPIMTGTYFPRSTETWYPRHGHLSRSRFDISMIHRKRDRVASIGEFIREVPAPGTKNDVLTEFRMDEPVPLASFAVGPYEIHKDVAKNEKGKELPLEFYSMPGSRAAIKEDFILAEMSNSVRYFSAIFGDYPYSLFRGVYHPFNFGQGFATTIMIPNTDRADYFTYSFIAHETSHQWWGDQVLWRSYRDQWLSEGFAEYSGMLYTQLRDKTKSEKELVQRARESLKEPPRTLTGIGPGRLADVAPLVMGYRAETRETQGAYTALIYNKGALVLRMLHFLFTDPQTGNGNAFFDLMADFVKRYNGKAASTEQFFAVANEHLKDTALAKRYGYKDLNWFYRQWVTQTYLPSYELSYHLEDLADGAVLLKGDLAQKGLPSDESWQMPLPLVISFPGGGVAHGTVVANGAHAPVNIKLARRPEKVELDPGLWVLSEKTSTYKQ